MGGKSGILGPLLRKDSGLCGLNLGTMARAAKYPQIKKNTLKPGNKL